jgi:hypothetical protein
VFREELVERAGRVPERRMREVDRALTLYLGLVTVR